jgi:hypothetical protein
LGCILSSINTALELIGAIKAVGSIGESKVLGDIVILSSAVA